MAIGGRLAPGVGAGNEAIESGDAMTAFNLSKMVTVAGAVVVLAVQSMGQQVPMQAASPVEVAGHGSLARRVIVVSLEDRKLALVENGQVKKIYPVAVGKPATPSPVGTFTIQRHVANPTYHHDGKTIPPGPGNPVGTRWMGLSVRGYGIHGTNEPNSIGKAASHGCIRMARADLEEFYELVAVGDTVELVVQRNEATAQLFGGSLNEAPSAVPQPALRQRANRRRFRHWRRSQFHPPPRTLRPRPAPHRWPVWRSAARGKGART
jgi:lipoprotein-anchoring transpeptidase ErfK/SrfK